MKLSPDDRVPGLVVSGLNSGKVQFLDNPKSKNPDQDDGSGATPWDVYDLHSFREPVSLIAADITGDGSMDLIVCHQYGPNMKECDMEGGWVSWLENPGRNKLDKNKEWVRRDIGHWPAMHRLRAGFFTQRFDGPNGLDSLLIASREGISRLFFEKGRWHAELLNISEPREPGQKPGYDAPASGDNWGSGAVDVGKVGDDPFAYIASMDPFHGTKVCVYTKTDRGLKCANWKRHVLDVYGTPTQTQKWGDGPGHYVVCGDFDGDGDDEFLVSLIGSLDRDEKGNASPVQGGFTPNKGIMYYKAINLEEGIFAKWRIANESSARIALGHFNGKKELDVASVSYNVKDYYEEPEPKVTLYTNNTALSPTASHDDSIKATLWDGEGLVYLAQPAAIKTPAAKPLIQVANYAISVEIYPPKHSIPTKKGEGVKVIYGSLTATRSDGKSTKRKPLGDKPFPALASTTSEEQALVADAVQGAIVLRMTQTGPELDWEDVRPDSEWKNASDVPVYTTFDLKESGLEMPQLEFTRVDQLWWGKDDKRFKGKEFYNMPGFHFRFLNSKVHIAHIQFWTAGTKVSAGAHNHADGYFNEIHITLSLGTKDGGMSMVKPEFENDAQDSDEAEELPDDKWIHVPQQPLFEHGSIWHRDPSGNARRGRNNVVSYPWHKWNAGSGENIDVWLALEFNPDLAL
ncbi:hypothetical protein SLS64_007767 [Diaporthe eres]|uniref:Aldos-2-ulose dehydratase/isomerase (AUDH) Cupin domain-containing protein n=1 Tax=Diaporthe eres TaxID=83184 RepID=A0ABR1P5Z7_DIAER